MDDAGTHATRPPSGSPSALLEQIRDAVDERRKHKRHPAFLPVQVHAIGPEGKAVRFQAATLDLSFSGMRIHCPRDLLRGSRVTVTVRFPEHKLEVDAHCLVVWIRAHADGGYNVGLRIRWKVPGKGKGAGD